MKTLLIIAVTRTTSAVVKFKTDKFQTLTGFEPMTSTIPALITATINHVLKIPLIKQCFEMCSVRPQIIPCALGKYFPGG